MKIYSGKFYQSAKKWIFVWLGVGIIGLSLVFSQEDPYGISIRPDNSHFVLESAGDTTKKFEVISAFPNTPFPMIMTHLTNANDGMGRLFLTSWVGAIWAIFEDSTRTEKMLYLDISDRVSDQGKAGGLFCLAFHPNYKTNGKFYVTYTSGLSSSENYTNRLSEFTVSKDNPYIADPNSERILIEFPHPDVSHHMNNIVFGPDGYLYVGVGDGGYTDPNNKYNAQDYSKIMGSILRIDVNGVSSDKPYIVPSTNPYYDNTQGIREEIWVKGVRQPWRFNFDSQNGDLWLADVGSGFREEINIVQKGENYGWPYYEGNKEMMAGGLNLKSPIFEYNRENGNCAIGGNVYRGARFPELNGMYIYADYGWKVVQALKKDPVTNKFQNIPLATASHQITSFGQGESGTIYFATSLGGIQKLVRKSGNDIQFPTKLSQTGMFKNINTHELNSGLIPYDVNSPQYTGGIQKKRYIALPNETHIYFRDLSSFEFPNQTTFVEEYFIDTIQGDPSTRKYLETRMLIKRKGTPEFDGYSYIWNSANTEADLNNSIKPVNVNVIEGGVIKSKSHLALNSTSCSQCHQSTGNYILGFSVPQLNKNVDYGGVVDNQLRTLNHIGIFHQSDANKVPMPDHALLPVQPDPYNEVASLENRVYSYLDVNCKHCHSKGHLPNVDMDLRFNTHSNQKNIVGVDVSTQTLGLLEPQRIKYGDPANSAVLHRMGSTGGAKMPPLPDNGEKDTVMLNVLTQWIGQLTDVEISPKSYSHSKGESLTLSSNIIGFNDLAQLKIIINWPRVSEVVLKLVRVTGEVEQVIPPRSFIPGKALNVKLPHEVTRGVYFLKAELPGQVFTKKLIIQ